MSLRITLVMPTDMANTLKARAEAEMRSVSGYVGRVIVEALSGLTDALGVLSNPSDGPRPNSSGGAWDG